jgi:hypothetical protein
VEVVAILESHFAVPLAIPEICRGWSRRRARPSPAWSRKLTFI